MQRRSCWSFSISMRKPWPSSPSRFATGTRQSSKKSSLVSWPRRPSLSSLRPSHEAGRAGFDDDQADPLVGRLGVGVGLGDDDEEVADLPVAR